MMHDIQKRGYILVSSRRLHDTCYFEVFGKGDESLCECPYFNQITVDFIGHYDLELV